MRIKSFLITAIFSGIILCSAGIASAQAVDNSALIAQIQAQIAQLTAQLQTMLAQQDTVTATWCHNFNTNLGFANSGTSEVSQLHIALQKQGISYAPDGDNVYSDGTSRAVIIFQERYASEILTPVRLTRGTGFTASSTRAKLNALYGCSQAAQTTPTVPTIATCAESNWTSTLNPSTCPASGQQTKTWTKTGTCQNGAFHPSVETVICTPVTPQSTTCTSFTYSDWSACSASGTQTRTVTSSLPAGCVGGNSILSQACTYTQPSTGSTCTSVGISNWSACSASGTQTRTVTSSSPVGCTINPAWSFSRACTYVQPSTVTTDCTPYYSDIIAYNPALHVAVRSGETRNIYWSAPGASASSTVSISISCENDPSIISIVGGISARSGFYSWTVPNNAHFTSVPRLCSGYKVSYLTGGPVVCPK